MICYYNWISRNLQARNVNITTCLFRDFGPTTPNNISFRLPNEILI